MILNLSLPYARGSFREAANSLMSCPGGYLAAWMMSSYNQPMLICNVYLPNKAKK